MAAGSFFQLYGSTIIFAGGHRRRRRFRASGHLAFADRSMTTMTQTSRAMTPSHTAQMQAISIIDYHASDTFVAPLI